MRKLVVGIVVLAISGNFTSCTTFATPEMEYFGDVGTSTNVMGKTSVVNFAEARLSSDDYADEYEKALANAFANAPKGTAELRNIKAYVLKLTWPQFYGAVVFGGGAAAAMSDNPTSKFGGVFVATFGILVSLVNAYDYVLVGEPVVN